MTKLDLVKSNLLPGVKSIDNVSARTEVKKPTQFYMFHNAAYE